MQRSKPLLVVLSLLAALAMPRAAEGADPFYERLLQKGKRTLAADPISAAEDLRLACFGLLDEPQELLDCLVHLAAAQSEAGDGSGFQETFTRIVDTESRFPGYAGLTLDPRVRETFESALETSVAYESLIQIRAFQPLARRVFEARLAALPANQRREELAGLRTREPDQLRWLIMLSEAELEDRQFNQALEMAEAALRRDSELLRALCVRGRSLAALQRCDEALDDLVTCDRDSATRNSEVTLAQLRCQVTTGGWDEAQILHDQLTGEGVTNAEMRRMGREIRKGLRQQAAATPPEPASDDTEDDGTGDDTAGDDSGEDGATAGGGDS